jgi:predicted nucleic-acid-binding protein
MGREEVRITADTNVLVRVITSDDPHQSSLAERILEEAETVALPLPALCELVWVLAGSYGIPAAGISEALRRLLNAANVVVDRPAAEAGLSQLDSGGDFADGVIAFGGAQLGSEAFVSFDRKAVALLQASGQPARLLA